jgi:hypothetical protein
MMHSGLLLSGIIVVNLTDLVILITGKQESGWDDAAWHAEGH